MGTYSKAGIPESTFPDRFFLLAPDDIGIGVAKASPLLARLGFAGDRLIVLETRVAGDELRANTGTGLGCFVGRPYIQLTGVHALSDDGALVQWSVEDAMARSLRVLHPQLLAYDALAPRSVSLLPIAKGYQARCAFCFSHASISADQQAGRLIATSPPPCCAKAAGAGRSAPSSRVAVNRACCPSRACWSWCARARRRFRARSC